MFKRRSLVINCFILSMKQLSSSKVDILSHLVHLKFAVTANQPWKEELLCL